MREPGPIVAGPAVAGPVIAVYVMGDAAGGRTRVGVTTDLDAHIRAHRSAAPRRLGVADDCRRLVWFEPHDRLATAVVREQALLSWRPEWIAALVEAGNPQWRNLADAGSDPAEDDAVLI